MPGKIRNLPTALPDAEREKPASDLWRFANAAGQREGGHLQIANAMARMHGKANHALHSQMHLYSQSSRAAVNEFDSPSGASRLVECTEPLRDAPADFRRLSAIRHSADEDIVPDGMYCGCIPAPEASRSGERSEIFPERRAIPLYRRYGRGLVRKLNITGVGNGAVSLMRTGGFVVSWPQSG